MLLINNNSLDPYFNHALEEYFLKNSSEEYFILWRSKPCVLIGKNQNTYNEINLEYVQNNNLPVVRRLSGGGAIFNDLGNILFGFISNHTNDIFGDFKRFTQPIINVLFTLGVNAELTGRNDLTIQEKKFSGNAQARHNNRILHHGSILYNTDLSQLNSALKINPLKYQDKAVKSITGRVTNISTYLNNPMDIEDFMNYIFEYILNTDNNSKIYNLNEEDIKSIDKLKNRKTSTWEWNYGSSPKYNFFSQKKFSGGVLEVKINIQNGFINMIKFTGDFFCEDDPEKFEHLLMGKRYDISEIRDILTDIEVDKFIQNITSENIIDLMFN